MEQSAPTLRADPKADREVISFPLGTRVLKRLNLWGKIVGTANILTGVIFCLGLFISAVPLILVGILQVVLGLRLMMSAKHLSNFLGDPSSRALIGALENLRSYLFLNSILLGIFLILLIGMAVGLYLFGVHFWEVWERNLHEFVLGLEISMLPIVSG